MVHTWQGTRFRQLKQLKQFISNREYAYLKLVWSDYSTWLYYLLIFL